MEQLLDRYANALGLGRKIDGENVGAGDVVRVGHGLPSCNRSPDRGSFAGESVSATMGEFWKFQARTDARRSRAFRRMSAESCNTWMTI